MNTIEARKRREQRERIASLDAALRRAEDKIEQQAKTIVAGINERNRLHVEAAKRDGIYERRA